MRAESLKQKLTWSIPNDSRMEHETRLPTFRIVYTGSKAQPQLRESEKNGEPHRQTKRIQSGMRGITVRNRSDPKQQG